MSSTAVNTETVVHRGVCRKFDNGKGWGFLVVPGYGDDVFVYFGNIVADGFRYLRPGDIVTCEIAAVPKGWEAVRVWPTGKREA